MFIKSVFSQQSTAEGTTRKTVTVAFGGRMSLVVLKSSGSGGGGGGGGGPVPVDKHAWRHAKKGPDAVTPKSIGAHLEGGSDDLDFRARELSAKNTATDNLLALQADIQQADIQQAYIKKVIAPEIVSPEYVGGALGRGFRYYIDENGNSVMVLDKLRVMKEAMFNVLTVSELRSVGGQILLTYADARVEAVVEKQSAWRCYYDSGEGGQYWIVGDQARCQKFTGDSGESLKYYWRLVTAVGNEELGGKMLQWIELSKEVAEGEGVPQVGDQVVGLGHRGEDRRRKNAKLISAFGETGVEEISYANIDGFSLVGKETAYQSPERWRVRSNAFELVAGNGIVYPTVVERGAWRLADAPYYYYDRVSHGGNIYLCIDKRLDGTMVEPATDQHAVWLCEVRKGDQGLPGVAGPQGVPGMPGKDGLPTYTWIRYADTAAGVGMSNDPTGKIYIGFAYNKTTATESNTPGDYMWSLIKGGDGVKGEDGSDGQTTYTWIKYADNADGTGLYDLPKTTTKYIGIATNKTTATESSLKTDYIWSQFKGDTGAAAPRLKTQFSINGTTAWHDAYAVGDAYRRESNDNGATWSVAMRMVGEKGDSGADGKKTPYTDFSYAYGLSQPTVWLDAPPTKVEGQHLWERIQKYTPKADNSGWTLASTSCAIINEFVQIGGVNLVPNSKLFEFQTVTDLSKSLEVGKIYTLSIARSTQLAGSDTKMLVFNYTEGSASGGTQTYIDFGDDKNWTFEAIGNTLALYAGVLWSSGNRAKIEELKLEKGNKATDWTAAPEDVQAEIDKANAMLADIASDSKLTPTEKQQTALEWSRIKAEQAKNTAAATAAGVSTAEVTIAYNTLNGYLETGANPLLKDLTTTSDIAGSTFRSTFATWYDKNASLVNATAEAVARNAADEIQVGGRNYALDTAGERRIIYWRPGSKFKLSPKIIDQEVDIIITFWEKDEESTTSTGIGWGSDTAWSGVYFWYSNTSPGKRQIKVKKPAGVSAIYYFKNSLSTTYDFSVQTGDKEMDWSPAPEDTQAEIDNIQIGGVNLIPNSKLFELQTMTTLITSLIVGQSYTLSIEQSTSLTGGQVQMLVYNYIEDGNSNKLGVYIDFGRNKSVTFIAVGSNLNLYAGTSWSSGNRAKIEKLKLEKGNKATDWSPAPEDVQAEIDASKSVVYAISPSAEQVKKIVTTAANGVTATSLLPSAMSVSVTRKKGNEDATVVSSFAMKYFSNKGASAVIGAWPLDLGPIAKDWEWLDLVLYSDATYAKELARKRIHINENADISGAEIAARINASGSEVQIEGEKISVIGKMISLNKMTVDVDGNATMNDVTMNNADISGKVTASSGSIGPLNVEPGKLNCGVLEISEITENSHDYDGVSPVYGRVGPFPVKGGGTVSGKWQSTEAIQLGRPNDVTLHFGLAAVMPQAGSYNVKVRFRAEDIRGNTKVTFPEFLGHGYYGFPRRFTLYGFPAGCYLVMEVTGDMTGQQLLPVTFRLSAMNDNMVPKLSSPYIYYSNGSTVIIDRSGTRIGYGSTIQYVGDGRISFIQRQNSGVFEFSINDVKLVLDKTKLIKLMNLIK